MKLSDKQKKDKFEEMLKYFDLPHKKMNDNVYLIGQDIAIRFLGDPNGLIGLEEKSS
jgi:hypothetical protein